MSRPTPFFSLLSFCSFLPLALTLLLAPLVTLPAAPEASAQSLPTLVSNLGQADDGTRGFDYDQAQAFTTGPNKEGYLLKEVDVRFNTQSSQTAVTLTVNFARGDGTPGFAWGRLTSTQLGSTGGSDHTITFTAPGDGVHLDPNEAYILVLNATQEQPTSHLRNTTSDGEDAGGASGFSIANTSLYRNWNGSAWTSSSEKKKIAIRGVAKTAAFAPPPASTLPPPPASSQVPQTWPLIPADLGPGDRFRLLFVTSTGRDATATDIATYNSFVQQAAAGGHGAIRPYSAQFRVVGSTATVDARDNTMTTGTGVPVYWLGGERVADDYAGFYGPWSSYRRPRTETGARIRGTGDVSVWTGTKKDGTKHPCCLLGHASRVIFGEVGPTSIFTKALSGQNRTAVGDSLPFYGLSPVFTVDTRPEVRIAGGRAVVEGDTAEFTLRAVPVPSSDITVTVRVSQQGNFAAARLGVRTVTIPAGGRVTFTVPTENDRAKEPHGAVTVTVNPGAGYTVAAAPANAARVAVEDDDEPIARFAATFLAETVAEAAGTRHVAVRISPVPESALTLRYSLAGDATRGSDYTTPGQVAVPAGTGEVVIPVTIVDDAAAEGHENVVLNLRSGAGYKVDAGKRTYRLTIGISDEAPEVRFAAPETVADEGSGTWDVRLNVKPAPSSDLTVNYRVSGTATAGDDFTIANAGTVTMAAGVSTATIPVVIVNDGGHEPEEHVWLELLGGAGYGVSGVSRHLLRIADDDGSPLPVASFAATASRAYEKADPDRRDAAYWVYLTLDRLVPAGTVINYRVGGTARAGVDYAALSGSYEFPSNAKNQGIPLVFLDDGVADPGETLVLTLLEGEDCRPGARKTHTITIADAPAPGSEPAVSFAAAASRVDEGFSGSSTQLPFEVPLVTDTPLALNSPLTVRLEVGGTATRSTDHSLANAIWASRMWGGDFTTYDISIVLVDDAVPEPGETVVLTLVDGPGYTVGEQKTHVVTIADNDVPVVAFAAPASEAREVSGTHPVEVALLPAPPADVTLRYWVSGTATPDADYTALPGTLAVTAGTSRVTIDVPVLDDSVEDSNETVVLTLREGEGYRLGPAEDRFHILVIVNRDPPADGPDDDPAPAAFVPDAALVAKVAALVEKHRGSNPGAHERLSQVLQGMTGEAGGYTAAACRAESRRHGAGVEQRWQPWCDEIARRENWSPPAQQPTPTPEIRITGGANVTEGADAVFTLTASPAPASALTVDVTVTAAGDYATAGTHQVTIPTGGTAALTVATTDDDTDEPDGSVTATLSPGDGYTVAASHGTAAVGVTDDDLPPAFVPDAALVAAVTAKADAHPNPAAAARLRRIVRGMTGEPGGYTATQCREVAATYGVTRTWNPWCDEIARRAAVAAVGAPGVVHDRLTLTLHDAEGQEGSPLTFRVTLSAPAPGPVSVVWLTRPGTATPHVDYTFSVGWLHFAPGATAQTVTVPTLEDAHDDSWETFTVALYAPRGAIVARGVATGTIRNDDPIPNAWLARFGRTVATHVTDAVSDRLRTPAHTPAKSQVTLGGVRLPVRARAASAESAANGLDPALLQGVAGWLGLNLPSAPAAGPATGREPPVAPDLRVPAGQALRGAFDLRQFLLGSSFRLNVGPQAATRPRLTAWGRFAGTTFAGRDGTRTATTDVDGDVFTGTVGLDATGTRWVAGVAVAHSQGTGGYTQTGPNATDQGDLTQTLTSLHPYLRYALTDRLDVWGLAGYGWGELDLERPDQETLETPTTLLMGAVGARGRLLDPAATGGYALATRTEALFSQTTSDAITGLAAGDAAAHRLRLILEGSRGIAWSDGRQLTPTVELGLRHDWGDAETGFGLELGGRVQYADPAWGLTVEGAVRGLVAHADAAYEEWGAWGTVRLAPGPNGQGLAVTLSPTWGAAASGVQSLWTRQTTAGLAPTGPQAASSGRVAAEVGYGVPAGLTGVVTPYAGTVLAAGADRTYRLGLRLTLRQAGTRPLDLTLEGTRQEAPGPSLPNQGLRLQATWGF